MASFSNSSSVKGYSGSFGNTSAITTATSNRTSIYTNSSNSNEIIEKSTFNGKNVVETFSFGNVSADYYDDQPLEFKISETDSYNVADLIRGHFTASDGNRYELYGSSTEGDQFKKIVDWVRDEIENKYNPTHSSQFWQFTSDEQMEKYFYDVLGITTNKRAKLIETYKAEHSAEIAQNNITDSDIWSFLIQNEMINAYSAHKNEVFEEDAKEYKHFENDYLLKQLDTLHVVYSDYAGFDINTLSDEEKIKWFYEFIGNEAKLDFANDEYRKKYDEAETWAEKEQIFAESCMYLSSVKMAEIDEQRFQDSLTWGEKIAGVVYETGVSIKKNFEVVWNYDSWTDAIDYIATDGTLQLLNDLGDGACCLMGYAVKGVGGKFVDDKELWDEAVGDSVKFWTEGNVADISLEHRMKTDVRFQDEEFLNMYYSARQLGRDGEMMLLNILGAPEIALPASILSSTGQQFNSAIAQGASYSDAIDYGSYSGTFDGTVNFLFARALGNPGASAAGKEFATNTFKGALKQVAVANGGAKMLVANVAMGYAQPWVNTLFKASTFSDKSYSELVKEDKVMENSVVSGTSSLVMMTTSALAKDSALGRKFQEITAKTQAATSRKNQTAIFVSKDVKQINEDFGGGRITASKYSKYNEIYKDSKNILGNQSYNALRKKASKISIDSKKSSLQMAETMAILNIDSDQASKFMNIYYDGMIAADEKYAAFFKNFRDHAYEHTKNVTVYALDIAETAKSYGLDVDLETVAYAAMCHDLGMGGGITIDGVEIDGIADLSDFKRANIVRKNHPLNSAITVLESDFVPANIRDEVALLAMSHSKSTSGISDFSDPKQWCNCIDKLSSLVNKDGKQLFNGNALKDKIKNDPSYFAKLQNEALAVRDGDAMSVVPLTKDGNTTMQTGAESVVEMREDYASIPPQASLEDELRELRVTDKLIYHDGRASEDVDSAVSIGIHVGETNVQFDSDYTFSTDNITEYTAKVNIVDANKAPNATWKAIEERLGEVVTYKNVGEREFTIILPKSMESSESQFGQFYRDKVEDFIDSTIDEANLKDPKLFAKYDSMENFNIKIEYK